MKFVKEKMEKVCSEWQVGKPLGISVMENTGVLTSVHKAGPLCASSARRPTNFAKRFANYCRES